MAYITKMFQYLTKKRRFPSRNSDSKESSFRDKDSKKGCFSCGKNGHFIVDSPKAQKGKSRKERSKKDTIASQTTFRNVD
jgi:hypothetical protein